MSNRALVKRLVLIAVLGTCASMLLMVVSVLYPKPLLLVVVMSAGQGIGLLALVLYLLAIALDLQTTAGSYVPDVPEESPPPPPSSAEA
jgi:hypothetical protein